MERVRCWVGRMGSLAFHLRVDEAFFEPGHADDVVYAAPEPVSDSVFGGAVYAGVVGDGHFDDGETCVLEERGKKPMDAVEGDDVFKAVSAKSFCSASGVAHVVLEDATPDGVGDPAGYFPDPGVVSGCPVAAYAVVLFE